MILLKKEWSGTNETFWSGAEEYLMDEETIAKLELYQGVQKMYEEEVEDLKGRDKEAIEERIESCRRLIQQILIRL